MEPRTSISCASRIHRATSGAISKKRLFFKGLYGVLYHAVDTTTRRWPSSPSAQPAPGKRPTSSACAGKQLLSALQRRPALPLYPWRADRPRHPPLTSIAAPTCTWRRATDRLAPFPTGLGQGLDSVFAYQAGEIFRRGEGHPAPGRRRRPDRQHAHRPVHLRVAAGDAGHRKVFPTLGRWF